MHIMPIKSMLRMLSVVTVMATVIFQAASREYAVRHIGVERGLSNNHVVGITQDKNGYLWIATDEGLNRFDGHSFKTYFKDKPESGGSLTGNELNAILDDPERHVIWIATARAGLNCYDYDNDTFSAFRHDDSDPNSIVTDDVTSLSPASDGGLWVTTYWGGFEHFNPDTGKFTHYSSKNVKGLPAAPIWSAMEGKDGNIYLAHEHAGLSVVDTKTRTARNYRHKPGNNSSLPSDDLQCIYRDSLNNIWVGTKGGLALYNPDNDSFINYSSLHPELAFSVSDIRQIGENNLWVAMERGGIATLALNDSLYSFPEKATCASARELFEMGSLSAPSVRSLYLDRYSNVWAGTWGGGISLISRNVPPFRLHSTSEPADRAGIPFNNGVLSLLHDSRHRLWIGKDGGGVYMQEPEKENARFFPLSGDGRPEQVVQAIYETADGDIWFGLFYGGALRYDDKYGFSQVFPSDSWIDVRDITRDRHGNIIFGTSSGIWRYDTKKGCFDLHRSVANDLIRKVFPLGNDRFLIGSFGGGLVITDSAFNELKRFEVKTRFPSNTVNDIFRSRNGHIWVATGEGLVEFSDMTNHPDSYLVRNRASGLANSHILAIMQDRGGSIWLSTNGGISCLKDGKIYNFSNRDNVPLGNFFGKSVTSDPAGNIYFGSISGLCYFNPVKVFEKVDLPRPIIVEVSVMDNDGPKGKAPRDIPVAGKDEIRLSPGQNSFDISFTTADIAMAKEMEYAYMLEGFDKDWVMARNENYVRYRELPTGSYIFKVKVRLRNQEWGEPATVKIIIPPPFYQSWWAIMIYVVITLGIVWTILYFYRRRVNAEALLQAEKEQHSKEVELNDERLRFYTNITHELRTPLTLIVGPLDDIAKQNDLSEKNRRSLSMVHRNAIRLLDLVNRLLEFRKTETQNRRLCVRRGNVAASVYEVALKYKELNRNPDVAVVVSAEKGDIQALYDKEVVTMILDNLISNAMKYTRKGKVEITCCENNGNVEISVKDSGKGISRESLPHIFDRYYQERGEHQAAGTGIGLALVKNLVNLHHGVIAVSSTEGKGSEFYVALPVDDAYPEALHPEETETAAVVENKVGPEMAMMHDEPLKPVVLVVEDNTDILEYVREAFTDLYDVRTAQNGSEGLRMAREIMPSVVVSDIMMPVMDGIKMTRELKGDVRTSHIPVILLTAKGTSIDREEGYTSGADSYLVKPFNSSLLQSRITNLLNQRLVLQEKFASRPDPAPESGSNTLAGKKEKLMKSLSDIDRKFIEKLNKTIIDGIPSENVDVNFIAGMFCMSSSTLYRKVKALTGISPNEYIRKIKMQQAEEMLLAGNLTFSEIAFKVGINSVAYFRACFKDEFGMTPSEYLRKINNDE